MGLELPEYHNAEQVKAAIAKQLGVIRTKEAEVTAEHGILKAIRQMCPHEYSARYSMGRDAGSKCDICDGWQ